MSCPSFGLGGYGGAEDKDEAAVGSIGNGHRFVPEGDPGAFAPYRSLDPTRLKLTGAGLWPLENFLDDELWLPFVEPKILRHPFPVKKSDIPNFKQESEESNLQLAYLWSTKGRLALFDRPPPGNHRCRVFNCFKNAEVDRQIGDRRAVNASERHLRGGGPSKHLPGGYLLTSITVPRGFYAAGSITDRKDFYHQAKVSSSRAHSNCLPFEYPRSLFAGLPALRELETLEAEKKGDRAKAGDRYGRAGSTDPEEKFGDGRVVPGFASLYQGDHLGVEYALSSHQSLLQSAGLLPEKEHVRGHCPFAVGPSYQCLVIDDFVAISVQKVGVSPLISESSAALAKAKEIYERHAVLGSPEKDVTASDSFTAIGTRIESSQAARSRGVCVVSSPPEKIASLVALTAKVFQLPVISRTLASRVAGSWTSVLLHRRCLSCLLDKIYGLGVRDQQDGNEVLPLSRVAAQELVMCCALSFVASSDVSVPFASRLFATDASLQKGAIVSKELPQSLASVVWLGGDKRGAYTKLDNPFSCALRHLGT